jgi:hypothetical protein
MGQIRIQTWGSFPTQDEQFTALTDGHAQAVADAIQFLATFVLPEAIERDHRLHEDGHKPPGGSFDDPGPWMTRNQKGTP